MSFIRTFKNREEYVNSLISSLTAQEQVEIRKWADERTLLLPDFGPYEPARAEQLTEVMIDGKELYQATEWLLRGDISARQFLWKLKGLTEDTEKYIHEAEKDEHEALGFGA